MGGHQLGDQPSRTDLNRSSRPSHARETAVQLSLSISRNEGTRNTFTKWIHGEGDRMTPMPQFRSANTLPVAIAHPRGGGDHAVSFTMNCRVLSPNSPLYWLSERPPFPRCDSYSRIRPWPHVIVIHPAVALCCKWCRGSVALRPSRRSLCLAVPRRPARALRSHIFPTSQSGTTHLLLSGCWGTSSSGGRALPACCRLFSLVCTLCTSCSAYMACTLMMRR